MGKERAEESQCPASGSGFLRRCSHSAWTFDNAAHLGLVERSTERGPNELFGLLDLLLVHYAKQKGAFVGWHRLRLVLALNRTLRLVWERLERLERTLPAFHAVIGSGPYAGVGVGGADTCFTGGFGVFQCGFVGFVGFGPA